MSQAGTHALSMFPARSGNTLESGLFCPFNKSCIRCQPLYSCLNYKVLSSRNIESVDVALVISLPLCRVSSEELGTILYNGPINQPRVHDGLGNTILPLYEKFATGPS